MPIDKPNILLILTDQQRADTIAALGNERIRTPNLDRLVSEGVAFTNAYSPSPVCAPARACLHYGQYPAKTQCLGNIHPTTPDDRESYADVFSRHGYETIGIGKCHFLPDRLALRGFKQRLTQEEAPRCIEDDDYLKFIRQSPYKNTRDVHGTWRDLLYMPQTSPLDEAHHPTQWVGDRTIDFIREKAGGEHPWMAFCSFIHPHPPYAPPAPWDMLYTPDEMELPYQPAGYESRQPAFQGSDGLHHYYFDPPVSDTLWRMVKSRYYACISFVDHQIGRILDALESSGQLDNTLIVFSSDHGEMLGDLGLIGKGNMYESSARIPLVVRWGDGRHAGERVDLPVTLVDVAPTMLAAAGLPQLSDCDGEDLHQLIDCRGEYTDRIVFSHLFNPDRGRYMSRSRRYKYIHSASDHIEQLFDLVADPNEDVNLIDKPSLAGVKSQLKEALFNYLKQNAMTAGILNEASDDWKDWPDDKRRMPRTKSNDPCPWWVEREQPTHI